MNPTPPNRRSPLAALERFVSSTSFAAWTLGLIAAYEVWLLWLLLLPAGDGAMAAFATEFRAWCFGADPTTGEPNWVQAFAMLTSPLLVVAVVWFAWGPGLRAACRRSPGRLLAHGATAATVSAACGVLLMVTAPLPESGPLPFPAVALRTSVPAPEVQLVDHLGQPFDLAAERGRVVLLTAIYSTCGYTCPGLLADLDATLAALSPQERQDVRTVIPTLDPERDTVGVLATVARARGFQAPGVRMLTGEPAVAEAALDRLGFERRRDPQTGVIDHPNLFVMIDRQGRIAYRLATGESQRQWLLAALRALLQENPGP